MAGRLCKVMGVSILLWCVVFTGGAAAVVNGKLYLFGGVNMNPHTPEGQDKAQAVTLHHVYDPAEDAWWEAGPMPDKKGWPAIAVYRDKIYIFGGDNEAIDRSMTTESWIYDPKTDTYDSIAPLPHPRSYCYGVTAGDYVYIFGARTLRSDGRADRSTFRYDPHNDTYKRTADVAAPPASSTTGSISPADSGSGSMMSASVPRRGDFLLRRSS